MSEAKTQLSIDQKRETERRKKQPIFFSFSKNLANNILFDVFSSFCCSLFALLLIFSFFFRLLFLFESFAGCRIPRVREEKKARVSITQHKMKSNAVAFSAPEKITRNKNNLTTICTKNSSVFQWLVYTWLVTATERERKRKKKAKR